MVKQPADIALSLCSPNWQAHAIYALDIVTGEANVWKRFRYSRHHPPTIPDRTAIGGHS